MPNKWYAVKDWLVELTMRQLCKVPPFTSNFIFEILLHDIYDNYGCTHYSSFFFNYIFRLIFWFFKTHSGNGIFGEVYCFRRFEALYKYRQKCMERTAEILMPNIMLQLQIIYQVQFLKNIILGSCSMGFSSTWFDSFINYYSTLLFFTFI